MPEEGMGRCWKGLVRGMDAAKAGTRRVWKTCGIGLTKRGRCVACVCAEQGRSRHNRVDRVRYGVMTKKIEIPQN